jgi:hypothetical protein
MSVYVICFDFFRPVDQIISNIPINVAMYEPLYRAIEYLGSSKQFTNFAFLLECDLTPKQIKEQLSSHMTIEDRIMVIEIKNNYEAHFDPAEWLQEHLKSSAQVRYPALEARIAVEEQLKEQHEKEVLENKNKLLARIREIVEKEKDVDFLIRLKAVLNIK